MTAPLSPRTVLTTGSWRERARWALRLATPFGISWLRNLRGQAAERERRAAGPAPPPPADTRYEEAVRFLVRRGLDEHEVREGSMPEASLDFLAAQVGERLPRGRPVRALHVGNFVGVSLCWLSLFLRERHPESIVVSVDPNVTHRGIPNPNAHVVALLERFGLLANNLIVPGYTLERSGGEDVGEWFGAMAAQGVAPEHVLAGLGRLAPGGFDLVLLDGNHSHEYLAREVDALRGLLAEGAVVVFDDVTEGRWDGVVEVFRKAREDNAFEDLGQDGRVGVLAARAGAGQAGGAA